MAAALAQSANPPVPPGRDPGGVAVAVIGHGLDYTLAHLTQRLTRDGEGEITGYDYADDDRRPFEANSAADTENPNLTGPGTRIAEIITGEGQAAALIAVRAKMDNPVSLTKAIRFATQGPARIIAIDRSFETAIDMEMFSSAARHYREHLFIVLAGDTDSNLDPVVVGRFGAQNTIAANLLIVAACDQNGRLAANSNWGGAAVDVAIDVVSRFVTDQQASLPQDSNLSRIALARVAALAARLLAIEPHIRGAAFKERIVRLAAPMPEQGPKATRAGFIERPQRHFWLE